MLVMKVSEGQSLIDIAIQYCGSADAAMAIAVLNELSITDDPIPGTELLFPDVVNADVIAYYKNYAIIPATLIDSAIQVSNVIDTVYREVRTIESNLIKVLDNQTFFDIAIQEFGSVEAAFVLALLNGYSVTDNLVPGTLLQRTLVIDKKVSIYYSYNNLHPATGLVELSESGIFNYVFNYSFE